MPLSDHINTPEKLAELCALIRNNEVVAIDMESNGLFRYPEFVCLIQVGIKEGNFLVDPIAVKDITLLLDIFKDDAYTILLHNGAYDVISFARDYDCRITNLFDTAIGAGFLGHTKLGLDNVLKSVLDVDMPKNKKLQKSDWTVRPLTPEQIDYAKADVAYLLELHALEVKELTELGRLDWVKEENQVASQQSATPTLPPEENYLRTKGIAAISNKERAIFKALYIFRDEKALGRGVPPFKIMHNEQLYNVANQAQALLDGTETKARIPSRWRDEVLAVVADAITHQEIPMPASPPRRPMISESQAKHLKKLKRWREKTGEKFNLAAPLLWPQVNFDRLINCNNRTEAVEAIKELPVKSWQRELFSEEILEFSL